MNCCTASRTSSAVKVPRTTAMTSRLGWKKSIWIGMYCGLDCLHSTESVRQCVGRLPCPEAPANRSSIVEKIAVIVVVALVAGGALYLFGRNVSSRQRLIRSGAATIAGALAAAGAVYGLEALTGDDTQMVDNAM